MAAARVLIVDDSRRQDNRARSEVHARATRRAGRRVSQFFKSGKSAGTR